jgi:MvdC family ATP-grasp ribosomal peptide maturase
MIKETTRDVVLLLTHSGDFYTIDKVSEATRRRGLRPFRLDTDRFPLEVTLTASLRPDGLRHVIRDGTASLEARKVRSVWARKVWPPRLDENLDPQFYAMCSRESSAMLKGFLDCFHEARWVNDPYREYEAENKLRQLRVAAEVGLKTPRTLVTNDPQQARCFFDELEGRVVAKLLKPLSVSMEATSAFLYTSEVRQEDLEEAEMLRHCPMVFQERISKARELRIACVGENFFVGAIDASTSSRGRIDWRLSGPGECSWQADDIPDDVSLRLKALMRSFGLVYGAIDMIGTSDGEYVFLEVNPGGEWGMLERDLGLPISEALADALIKDGGD